MTSIKMRCLLENANLCPMMKKNCEKQGSEECKKCIENVVNEHFDTVFNDGIDHAIFWFSMDDEDKTYTREEVIAELEKIKKGVNECQI